MLVNQEPAAGVFHNVQLFIEGVSSVATSSASPSSLPWLLGPPCCWVVVEVIGISQIAGWKVLWVG